MTVNDSYIFQNSTKLISGVNALEHLAHEIALFDASRPLVMVDPALLRRGHYKKVRKALQSGGMTEAASYTDLPADAPLEKVDAAADHYRANRCDAIIAVGGGSVIDAAKGVSMTVSTGSSSVRDVMGYDRLTGKMTPLIAIPTTAGTGSESTLVAVLSDHEAEVKREYLSYLLQPHVAILDPEMTVSLPPRITAATGMDTLVHAVEAYTGRQKNPLSRAYAHGAVSLVSSFLVRAVVIGRDREARLGMANAAYMAGAAFSNSMVGAVHAIGHGVGAVCGAPHGEVMNILLPHVLRVNGRDSAVARDYAELAALFQNDVTSVPGGGGNEGGPARLIAEVMQLQHRLQEKTGLPLRLRDAGVIQRDFPSIVEKAWLDGAITANPIELTEDECLGILDAAW